MIEALENATKENRGCPHPVYGALGYVVGQTWGEHDWRVMQAWGEDADGMPVYVAWYCARCRRIERTDGKGGKGE